MEDKDREIAELKAQLANKEDIIKQMQDSDKK